MSYITETYPHRYRALQRKATATPLVFEAEARLVYRAYTRRERRETLQLNKAVFTADEFYAAWQDEIVPKTATITKAATDTKLQKELTRSLLLEQKQPEQYAASLAAQRHAEYQEAFLETHYTPHEQQARQAAARFLAQPVETNEERIQRYIDWQLYSAVADDYEMAVYDAQASLLKRSLLRGKVRRQTKRLVRTARRGLRKLAKELSAIEAHDKGLVTALVAVSIDLVSVRAAYRSYEKALKALSEDKQTPAARLSLYKEATEKIREDHLASLVGAHGLQDIQRAASEIDTVLLRVFDLSNREYNELMNLFKRYRDIQREQTRLQTLLRRS